MKPSPAFQFYPHDFLVGTAELTAEEVGAYIRLLCYQWVKNGLQKDDKKLMQLSGITDPYVLGNVVAKFGLCEDGMLRNARLEKVRQCQYNFRAKQSENGKKGGNPLFQKGKHNPYYNPKDNPLDNPKISSSSSSSSSNNKEEKKSVANAPSALNEFLQDWGSSFQRVNGVPYAFTGGKELSSVKRLLDSGIPRAKALAVAERVWKSSPDGKHAFWIPHSKKISSFIENFNQIISIFGAEIMSSKPKHSNEEIRAAEVAEVQKQYGVSK